MPYRLFAARVGRAGGGKTPRKGVAFGYSIAYRYKIGFKQLAFW
jgi:hypothetical protein